MSINSLQISDSLLLWTNDAKIETLLHLLTVVQEIFYNSYVNVIDLRHKIPPLKKGGQGGFLQPFENPPKLLFFKGGISE